MDPARPNDDLDMTCFPNIVLISQRLFQNLVTIFILLQDLSSQGMNGVKRRITTESLHKDSNCFLLLVIRYVQGG